MKEQATRIKSIHQEDFRQQSGSSCWRERRSSCVHPRKEGRIAQVWVHARGGMRLFAAYFWHTEAWFPRDKAILEAVLKRTRATKHPWLIACDANMSPENFERSLWFRKDQMHVRAPEGVSTCRSKNVKGDWIEKVYDYVIACNSLKGEISKMKVVEDFESRPHEAVIFAVERGRERQEWNEQKNCRRRCLDTVEEGCHEGAQKRRAEKKERKTSVAKKEESGTKSLKKSGTVDKVNRTEGQSLVQSWNCSQIENEEEEESLARKGPKWQRSGMKSNDWRKS